MIHWLLDHDRFEPAEEPLREAPCTLENGYFAMRAAAEAAEGDTVNRFDASNPTDALMLLCLFSSEEGWTGPTTLWVRDTIHEFRPGIVLELPCRARPT